MSYRASIVIREGGKSSFHGLSLYDPLPYLFLRPGQLKAFADSTRFDLSGLNNAWSETGILMDADGKQLLYFGSDDSTWEIGFRKVLDAFLERSLWPGWNVRFCPRHLVDFAEALGLESPMTPWLGDAPDLYDLKYWIGSESRLDSLNDGEISSAIMVRKGGAHYLHTIDSMYVTDILDHGEELVAPLLKPGLDKLVSGIDGDGLCSSALIDCDGRTLTYWYVDEDRPPEYFQRFWPGWELVDIQDDYQAFSKATDGIVTFDESIDMERAIAGIRACNHIDVYDDKPTIPPEKFESMLLSFLAGYQP